MSQQALCVRLGEHCNLLAGAAVAAAVVRDVY